MVEIAIAGDPKLALSLLDAPKPSGEPNYTIDTLGQLAATLAPRDELYCLVGADSFLTLRQWRQATALLLTYNLIVAARPGFALADFAGALPDSLAATLTSVQAAAATERGYQLFRARDSSITEELRRLECGEPELAQRERHRAEIYLMPDLDEDISATQVRAALASGTAIENLLQSEVVSYINGHNLYAASKS